MKTVYDKSFKYVPSVKTDIRKTFAKAREEIKRQKKTDEEAMKNVTQFQKHA